jgi:hypothetical protein
MDKVNLTQKLSLFNNQWSPKIVGDLNESYIKVAKLKGEFLIIPKGVEHLPVAEEEVCVMLIEPKSTLNTGNIKDKRTVENLDRI